VWVRIGVRVGVRVWVRVGVGVVVRVRVHLRGSAPVPSRSRATGSSLTRCLFRKAEASSLAMTTPMEPVIVPG